MDLTPLSGPIENPEDPHAPREPVVRIPSRAEVRQLVATHQAAMLALAEAGGAVEHLALDQQDQVHAYAAALEQVHGVDAALAFRTMWVEELEAATSLQQREVERLTAENEARAAAMHAATAQQAASDDMTAQWIVALVIVVLGVVFIGMFVA